MPEEKIRRSSHQMSTMDPVKWFKQDAQEIDTLAQEQFYALVEKYEEQFMTEGRPLGKTSIVKHSIYTGNHVPIKQRPRQESLGMKDVKKRNYRRWRIKESLNHLIARGQAKWY